MEGCWELLQGEKSAEDDVLTSHADLTSCLKQRSLKNIYKLNSM